ncbi:MAG: hypothetical protein KAT05_11920, partial [Spirochaetes bacterium]|nr:hypothetical protein [Spirochaetota bacterium]
MKRHIKVFNWRESLIYLLLYLIRSKVPAYLKEIKGLEYKPLSELKEYQHNKLKKLLIHAYLNVPYY